MNPLPKTLVLIETDLLEYSLFTIFDMICFDKYVCTLVVGLTDLSMVILKSVIYCSVFNFGEILLTCLHRFKLQREIIYFILIN